MLKKSVMLGSSLAVALAFSGAAWAGDQGKDDYNGYKDYTKIYCPAKNETKCDKKGGDFKSYWGTNYCLIKTNDVKYCNYEWNFYKIKVEDSTLWKYNTRYRKCDSYEKEKIKACFKKIGYKWVYLWNTDECQKCLDHEDDDQDNSCDKNDKGKCDGGDNHDYGDYKR